MFGINIVDMKEIPEGNWGGGSSPVADPDELGTTLLARKAGFLCVISLLSTLRKPLVTSSPRLSSAKTAAAPPPELPLAGAAVGAGGGGGGGGGAPLVDFSVLDCEVYWATGIPYEDHHCFWRRFE